MTSSEADQRAFVWIWLPHATEPIIAGKLELFRNNFLFNYAKSYLERDDKLFPSIPIYEPELPLKSGVLDLIYPGLDMPGCLRDASPDAWGRRVILNKQTKVIPNELTYLLESGSDRIGALDFQRSSSEYIPRLAGSVCLEELLVSAQRVEKGESLTKELDQALFHSSSIGGAKPKALIENQGTKYIAKFSSINDPYNVVKAEFIAMKLAQIIGLDVASVKLEKVANNKDVLLIKRFDRQQTRQGWLRKSMVSALTLFGLDEMTGHYGSYATLAEIIRHRFHHPQKTIKELFSRLVFNILCGNTDDHARNHAAFWDGKKLTLTPAYDICPQNRTGNEASQAMFISGHNRLSQLKYVKEATHHFLITQQEALCIFEEQISAIKQHWDMVCEEAQLSEADQKLLWGRQFLNPYSIKG